MNDACPKCSGFMKLTEKDTSSGREIHEYTCSQCGYSDWEDRGTALWQVLSDAREEAEANLAASKVNTSAVSGTRVAIDPHCKSITADNAAAWFRHCGYGLQQS